MRALLDILVLGFRGRIVRRAKRLRDPRQVLALLAGGAYFAFFVLRPFLFGYGRGRHGRDMASAFTGLGDYAPAVQLAIALGLALVAVTTWITASSKPSFRLNEAEIHILMPAPLTRRQILQFALLKQQMGILVGAFVLIVFTALRSSGSPSVVLPRFVSYWGFLTLLDLHIKGVSLWKARLLELPAAAARLRRGAALVAGAAWCAGIALGLWLAWQAADMARSLSAGQAREAALAFAAAARGGLAGWLLTPLLWIAAMVAGSGAARLWGGLFLVALLAVHYEWVVRSSASFEEAALARAQRQVARGRRRPRWDGLSRPARQRAPFRLEAARVPELAITWKNLLLRGRTPLAVLARRTLLALAILTIVLMGIVALGLPTVALGVLAGFAFLALGLMPLLAGNFLRNDLHVDFLHLETLRAWPLAGWRLIAAEVLAPAASLLWIELTIAGVIAAVALASGVAGGPGELRGVMDALPPRLTGGAPFGLALAVVLASAVGLGMAVGLFSIALQNLGILLFPGWVPLGFKVQRGTAMFGQNLVVGVGRLIGLALGAIPSVLLAGLVFALLNLLLSVPFTVWELPLLALAAALPFLAEVYFMLRTAGAIWDRLDPSQELLDPVA